MINREENQDKWAWLLRPAALLLAMMSNQATSQQFTRKADLLNVAKIDPCEDFFRFACGNWEVNTLDVPSINEEVSPLLHLYYKFKQREQ
ncbi:hypothetical protein TELCIR_05340, partial [Teladorsagia circumcincta]